MTLWLHICVLVRDVDAISSHQHLAVELVVDGVHCHLARGAASEYASGQARGSKARCHVQATVVARGAHTLVEALRSDPVLLALVLARRLQGLHLSDPYQSLVAVLSLCLRDLSVRAAKPGKRVCLHVHVASAAAHQQRVGALLLVCRAASPTTIVIIGIVVELVAILLSNLDLWRDLHVSILLLVHQQLLVGEDRSGYGAAGARITVLGCGEVCAPRLWL